MFIIQNAIISQKHTGKILLPMVHVVPVHVPQYLSQEAIFYC